MLLLLGSHVALASEQHNKAYIVNGSDAKIDDYSSFVSLYYNPDGYIKENPHYPYCVGYLLHLSMYSPLRTVFIMIDWINSTPQWYLSLRMKH